MELNPSALVFDSKDNKENAYGVQLLPSDRRVVEIEWTLHYSDEKEKNEELIIIRW